MATQKPTVDVITGLIKSNLPARICFQVASRTDSRVVLDEMGAEKLLGNGDMLFLFPGTSTMLRGQGTFLSDDEINRVLECAGATEQQFVSELVQLKPADAADKKDAESLKNRDELYDQAVDLVIREGRGSVSLLQRALGIGYGRAARLIDYMAEDGIVGQYNGSQAREVLITLEQWAAMSGQAEAEPVAPSTPARMGATTTALSVTGLAKPKRNRILPDADEELDDDDLSTAMPRITPRVRMRTDRTAPATLKNRHLNRNQTMNSTTKPIKEGNRTKTTAMTIANRRTTTRPTASRPDIIASGILPDGSCCCLIIRLSSFRRPGFPTCRSCFDIVLPR